MSAQSMLEQLLRSGMNMVQGGGGQTGGHASGGGLGGLLGGLQGGSAGQARPGQGTDWGTFGAGAATGGVLGLLLGSKQGRRYGGKALKYGSVAAIGLMAYKAYSQWQQNQAGQVGAATTGQVPGQTAGQAAGQTAGPSPRPAAAALPAPRTVDQLPADQAEQHSRAMLLAMVAAAKADGHLDPRERGLLDEALGRLAADHGTRQWVDDALARPLDPAEVARHAHTPELAAEVYLASLLVADDTSFMERAYLDELARQLRLDPGLKAQLHAQAEAA